MSAIGEMNGLCLTVGEGAKIMAAHGHGSTTRDIAFPFAVIARASLVFATKVRLREYSYDYLLIGMCAAAYRKRYHNQ